MATQRINTGGLRCPAAWVEAAPFRAHLQHLMAVGQLSVAAVAVLTGVSYRSARHLLYGRGGRAVRRISPDTARRLLSVTAAEAAAVAGRMVPAASTRSSIARLRVAGWSDHELAGTLGLRLVNVAALADGQTKVCTQLVALRALGEARVLEAGVWMPGPSRVLRAAA